VDGLRPLCNAIIQNTVTVEAYVKDRCGFWSTNHFGKGAGGNHAADHGPACHCSWFAFGRLDPAVDLPAPPGAQVCGHVHMGECVECKRLRDMTHQLQELIDITEIILCRLERPLPGHQPEPPHRIEMLELEEEVEVPIQVEVPVDAKSRDDLKKQLEMLIWYRRRYQHYLGHQARLCHESAKRKKDLQRLIDDPTLIMITGDWAMKFLSLKYREAMVDWFGKKGIAWHGLWVVWYDQDSKEFKHYHINQISNESKEDGELVAQDIATAILAHQTMHPQHTGVMLRTDGAGCYNGISLMSRLAYMWHQHGFKIVDHSTGECGGGKCEVDRNFSVDKANVGKGVIAAMGSSDVTDARSLVDVLNARRTDKNNSVSYVTKAVREAVNDQPVKSIEVDKGKLQSKSFREFTYDDVTKLPLFVKLFEQSSMGGPEDAVIHISTIWPHDVPYTRRAQCALTVPGVCLVPRLGTASDYVLPEIKAALKEEKQVRLDNIAEERRLVVNVQEGIM
jgi:hypothetical protein